MKKKAETQTTVLKTTGRTRRVPTGGAVRTAQPLPLAPVLEHEDWPSDAQWLAFWARQEQVMLQQGLLGPQAAEALGE